MTALDAIGPSPIRSSVSHGLTVWSRYWSKVGGSEAGFGRGRRGLRAELQAMLETLDATDYNAKVAAEADLN